MKEFLTEHWLLIFALFMYAMGFLSGYFNGKIVEESIANRMKREKMNTEIKSAPFSWNDNFSEEAIEDFQLIQKGLSYVTCQSIGLALAKLEILEKQGCKVDEEKEDKE